MADGQITILGMSGAGKTCYLLGLYYKMGSGLRGYTITTNDDTDVILRDRYAKLCDASLEKEKRFPAGTDNTSTYEFDLCYGYKKIMSFDWLDYPGGALERKNTGNLKEYEYLKSSINNSSCLFICVDGELLCGDDTEEKIDKVKDNCANVINTFFSDYQKTNNRLPPTAIIVTKYDMCSADTDEDELCDIIEEAFSPFFIKGEGKKLVTIIPVSIGVNLMDNDCTGKLKPVNIHLPIFMGIWFSLNTKIKKSVMQAQAKDRKNKEQLYDLQRQKMKEKSRFFTDYEKLKRLQSEIEQKDNSNREEYKQMLRILDIMTNDADRLIKELDKIKHVYLDGKRQNSFSDILDKSK